MTVKRYLIESAWRLCAAVVSRRLVASAIIKWSMRRPYSHIVKGNQLYMSRYWVFNPYQKTPAGRTAPARWRWLPSIRVHHITHRDTDLHEHDHPWDARTIILRGAYAETRKTMGLDPRIMSKGDTSAMNARDFHHIVWVSTEGAWTLFFTWDYVEEWGYNVDGQKVGFREYHAQAPLTTYIGPAKTPPKD